MLPFEFTVQGPPLSHQTKDRKKLAAWRSKVRKAAKKPWAFPPVTIPLRIVVGYYHEGAAVSIDSDNMVKPIQDALNKLIYRDDNQIVDTVLRRTPIDHEIYPRGASWILLKAFSEGVEFLHIKVERKPDHRRPIK